MPGIELYGRGSSDEALLRKMSGLCQRALTTANQYLALKLGPGKAEAASMLLNVMAGNVELFQPPTPEKALVGDALVAANKEALENRSRVLLQSLPAFRRAFVSTLWIRMINDQARQKKEDVSKLEGSWAFRTFSADYPMPTLSEYEIIVRDFEEQLERELGEYFLKYGGRQ